MLKTGIPKRKKADPKGRLPCKIDYFIKLNQPCVSGTAEFFTGD
jgi:hypothetical protein